MIAISGRVIKLVTNDQLIILDDEGTSRTVVFNSLVVPKFHSKNSVVVNDKGGQEARDYLRLLLVDKRVIVKIANSIKNQDLSARDYGEVIMGEGPYTGYSVNEALVREGLANLSVKGGKDSEYSKRMSQAQEEAKESMIGIHGDAPNASPISDFTEEEVLAFFNLYQGKPSKAVVEYVSPNLQLLCSLPEYNNKQGWIYLAGLTMNQNREEGRALDDIMDEVTEFVRTALYMKTIQLVPVALATRANGTNVQAMIWTSANTNFNELLLKKGFMFVFEPACRDNMKELGCLLDAEESAKKGRLGVWRDHTQVKHEPIRVFTGTLVEVVSGDCLWVSEHDNSTAPEFGKLHKLYLTLVRGPFGEGSWDAMQRSRSALAKLVMGQRLTVHIDHYVDLPPEMKVADLTKTYATIFTGNINVTLKLLQQGFVKVGFAGTTPANSNRTTYMQAEAKAPSPESVKHEKIVYEDCTTQGTKDAAAKRRALNQLKSIGTFDGELQFMLSPSKFKVQCRQQKLIIMCSVTNMIVPRTKEEPLGQEALIFAKINLMHRAVRLRFISIDKAGSVLCEASVLSDKGARQDYRHMLLESGYGGLMFQDRDEEGRKIQDAAFQAKKGMWSVQENRELLMKDLGVEEVQENAAVFKHAYTASCSVVHVNDVNDFYIQNEDAASLKKKNDVQAKLQTIPKVRVGSPFDVRKGRSYCALYDEDNRWYRCLVVQTNKKAGTCEIFYGDYGNTAEWKLNDLFVLPPELSTATVPFGAVHCSLGACRDVAEIRNDAARMFFDLTGDGPFTGDFYTKPGANKFTAFIYKGSQVAGECLNINLIEQGGVIYNKDNIPPSPELEAAAASAHRNAINAKKGLYRYTNNYDE